MEQVETKVDVLAVMDAACRLHSEGAHSDAWEVELAGIHAARAAIAELIEALKDTRAALDNVGLIDTHIDFYSVQAAINRADAALARVGGGK